MTVGSQFKVTKTITISIHWSTTSETPERHLEALEETGMDRAHEMMLQGYSEGELYDNITMPGDPEEGVDYRGWWTSEASIDREIPVFDGFAAEVAAKIRALDLSADVNPEFIDQAAEDGLSVIQAVQSWFADREFDCSNLHPLSGSVSEYGIGVVHLERPYIPISEESFNDYLKDGESDLYLTLSGVVVTYGTADMGLALMPLNKEMVKFVLDKHQESGADA